MSRRPWSRRRAIATAAACTVLAGCTGTMLSRGTGPCSVGKYPFEAIALDIGFMAATRADERDTGVPGKEGTPTFLWGLTSLPIDTVVDVVLLPVDVVAWIFGCSKTWESDEARRRWERDEPGLDPR